ncbi:MAG: contractile injection system protein, VgrG/Pvc8 family, partial [Pseudomonadota bacterium]
MSTDKHIQKLSLKVIGLEHINDFQPIYFAGEEIISADFKLILQGITKNLNIRADDLLGQTLTVKLQTENYQARYFNGVVANFTAANVDAYGFREYELILRPWLYGLKLVKDCRIFQQKNAVQIVKQLCQEHGFTDLDTSRLKVEYASLPYIVQYNETTHHFIHRLLAEANIYYYYRHQHNRHMLILQDNNVNISASNSPKYYYSYQKLPRLKSSTKRIIHWTNTVSANPQQFANVSTAISDDLDLKLNDRIVINADDFQRRVIKLTHTIGCLQHSSRAMDESLNTAESGLANYHNEFSAVAAGTPLKLKSFAKPNPGGTHSAIVCGPKGKVIFTNAKGWVKLHFPWDRYGQYDGNDSVWIPVAQLQVGDDYGTQFIPRIGDEVQVEFIAADIDQPVVLGSVFNGSQPPIYPTEDASKAISGIKTQLIGCNAKGEEQQLPQGHELRFDDSLEDESIKLLSAGDLNITVMGDFIKTVNADASLVIDQSYLLSLLNGRAEIQAKEILLQCGQSQLQFNAKGLKVKTADRIFLQAKGVGGTYAVARVGDKHHCPRVVNNHPCGEQTIITGSAILKVN